MTRLRDHLFNLSWLLAAVAAVLLAVYVVLAGKALSLLPERRAELAAWVGMRLGMRVEIDRIEGEMHLLTPEVRLRGVRLYLAGEDPLANGDEPALVAPHIDARIDVLSTLLARRPVLQLLRVEGVALTVMEGEDGRFRVKGFPFDVEDPRAAEKLQQALTVLYRQRTIVVARSQVTLESARLPVTAIEDISLHAHNDGDRHLLAGSATVQGGSRVPLSFVLHFSGRPMLPAELSAQLYLRARPFAAENWLPRRDVGPLMVDSLAAGGEAWVDIDGLRVSRVRGVLRADSVALSLLEGDKVEGLLGLSAQFRWDAQAEIGRAHV